MLFISIVRYAVQIFTPDTFAGREYRFFITVKGQGDLATKYQLMTETSEEMQGYVMCSLFIVECAVWQNI